MRLPPVAIAAIITVVVVAVAIVVGLLTGGPARGCGPDASATPGSASPAVCATPTATGTP